MCKLINIIDTTWENFIHQNPANNTLNKQFIYRGQTNGTINGNFKEWEIVSSFNRYYKKHQYKFPEFIGQQIAFIDTTYADYEFIKNSSILNSSIISKIYFLQHYGIPTCFLDFTFNPLVALYFSISSLKGQSGGAYSADGFPSHYSVDYYFTVIRIDLIELKKVIEIKNIEHFHFDLFLNYDSYRIDINPYQYAHLAFDLEPLNSIDNSIVNYNLKNQSSCFLMYDNAARNTGSLENFLKNYITYYNTTIKNPIITKYRIKYNSAFKPMHSRQPDYISLFKYLINNNVTGSNLFNDIQGIKYDFNFFHQIE